MTEFFSAPILNAPYEPPTRHWELDARRRPTGKIANSRREAKYTTAVPMAKEIEPDLLAESDLGGTQAFDPIPIINEIRSRVEAWRRLPPEHCGVTPTTARLLRHWREHDFHARRPFFCQVEAAETAIWLAEVAGCPGGGPAAHEDVRSHLRGANNYANPELYRIALKLATGAGKTTVMAMLIAWQTLNAVRMPNSTRFTSGFLIVTPGITIRDRLAVLEPNHPDNYCKKFELVPSDMLSQLGRAKIVITNFHAFKLRERTKLAAGNRDLLAGHGEPIPTIETEGQMLSRVCSELLGMKNVMVINDEAHHCYREKPGDSEEGDKDRDANAEAQHNTESARLWISGIEALNRQVGVRYVFDLSATPFFLSGSGYREGTLFPWTMSDFSLLDAIECGIVKLPRVPVADDVSEGQLPRFRELWKHVGPHLPKKRGRKFGALDPSTLPTDLENALTTLYGHYRQTFDTWQTANLPMPPVFIVVCNNIATSELVYKFIAGFEPDDSDGYAVPGRLDLFSNYSKDGARLERPRTLLIDSEQLESSESLNDSFLKAAKDEIARFKRELQERKRDTQADLTVEDLLRETLNTVGKPNRLGASIRCVVSVAMLSEGWDANTVTHILGVRAFGTQLLCEQVVGRALRRQSYETSDDGKFDVEYADVLGIPFDFAAEPVVAPPRAPAPPTHVHAVRPDRDHLRIEFPRVQGYAYDLGDEKLQATFTEESVLRLTPDKVGPTRTENRGILGENIELTPELLNGARNSTIAFHLAKWLVKTHFRDAKHSCCLHLFDDLLSIARQWLDRGYLVCEDGTHPSQLLYSLLADEACVKIAQAIRGRYGERYIRAMLDPCTPCGSTDDVDFHTTKTDLWKPNPNRSHLSHAVCDSSWERHFCSILDKHELVVSYAKNHGLGFTVPYRKAGQIHQYVPDFIVVVGEKDVNQWHVVVEIKGEQTEESKIKSQAIQNEWLAAVKKLEGVGRWEFIELTDIDSMAQKFNRFVKRLPPPWPIHDFKAMLAAAPLEGVDLERPPSPSREIDFF